MLIAQLTDLHVCAVGQSCNRVSETNMFAVRAFRSVAAMKPAPDVVLITGDLTESGMPAEYANLTSLLRQHLDMPIYVIPGNHDRRDNFRRDLAFLRGVTADPEFVQYAVEDYPVRLIMLDTVVFGSAHGELRDSQLAWLDLTLAAAPDKPTMIGMHHPPFGCGIAHMDKIALREPEAFAAIVARHSQVKRIVCGHHHRPIFAQLGQAIVSIAPPGISSSAGWKISRSPRGSSGAPASARAVPSRIAVCASWPQACAALGIVEAYGAPVRSAIGNASMSARNATRGSWSGPKSQVSPVPPGSTLGLSPASTNRSATNCVVAYSWRPSSG